MRQAKIGVQAMMLKEKFAELGAYETLKKVHELGYHAIEISQIPMTKENVAEIKRASHDFKLEIASLSGGLKPNKPGGESLSTTLDKIIADCKTLNSNIVRIGMLPYSAMKSLATVKDFCQEINLIALALKAEGIKLYYHNHHLEFVKYEGEYLLDIIRREAPDLGFEIDVHWVHRGGVNPVDLLKDYAGKVDLIHLKDYRMGQVPPHAFDSLAEGDYTDFTNYLATIIEFAELGQGSLDFKAIIEQGLLSGARYFLVEQDDLYGRDPFDCLADSRDYLIKLGYQHLF